MTCSICLFVELNEFLEVYQCFRGNKEFKTIWHRVDVTCFIHMTKLLDVIVFAHQHFYHCHSILSLAVILYHYSVPER